MYNNHHHHHHHQHPSRSSSPRLLSLLLLSLLLPLLHGSVGAAAVNRGRHQGEPYHHNHKSDSHHNKNNHNNSHHPYHRDSSNHNNHNHRDSTTNNNSNHPYHRDSSNSNHHNPYNNNNQHNNNNPYHRDTYKNPYKADPYKQDSYSGIGYNDDDPYDPYAEDDLYSDEDSYEDDDSYEEDDDLYEKDPYQSEGTRSKETSHYRTEDERYIHDEYPGKRTRSKETGPYREKGERYRHDEYPSEEARYKPRNHHRAKGDRYKNDKYASAGVGYKQKDDPYKSDQYSSDSGHRYKETNPYSSESSHRYKETDQYPSDSGHRHKEADQYTSESIRYPETHHYRQEGLFQRPASLPSSLNQHHGLGMAQQPLPKPIKIDFTNASSLSAYEELRARGTYLLGSPPGFLQQPPRTWTAKPRGDTDDTTTRDPSIPENPEGLKDPSLLVGPWEEEPTVRFTNAEFKGENGSIVEAQSGTTAKIPCIILNRADHETVSWIRLRDHHLITVGRQTYTNDERFSVTFNRHLNYRSLRQEWVLHLRYAQHRDAGEYVCQLSTYPPMVFISTLTITQAYSEISGGPERYVQEGSAVTLNCTLKHHTQPPEYVFWYHNRTMINYVTHRQVSVRTTGDGSTLTLAAVGKTDSGNYTCHPPNSRPASITLHIIAGDAPAAMQVSGASPQHQQQQQQQHLLLLLLVHVLMLGVGSFIHQLS